MFTTDHQLINELKTNEVIEWRKYVMDAIMQYVGIVASILALIISLVAFIKAGGTKGRVEYLEDRLEELSSRDSGSRKKKKRNKD